MRHLKPFWADGFWLLFFKKLYLLFFPALFYRQSFKALDFILVGMLLNLISFSRKSLFKISVVLSGLKNRVSFRLIFKKIRRF